MLRKRQVGLLLGALFMASSANAQERDPPTHNITLEQALSLARRQGPDIATAQARIGEANGRVSAASVWRFNPQVGAAVGPRFGGASIEVDWAVDAKQWIEIGGQGGDRVAVAQAGVDAAEARRSDADRLLMRDVGLTFLHALYWRQRVGLAQENVRIAEEIARIAQRRHEVGDTGGLEKAVAALAHTRSQIDEARTQAAADEVEGHLKTLLGLDANADVIPEGDLQQMSMPARQEPTGENARPDLQALDAEIRQAAAQADLGRAARIPNVALGASYSREEGADIVKGVVALTLPIFDHGQGVTAVADARRHRIDAELNAATRRAAIEVETARRKSERLSGAAREFEERGLVTLTHSEALATASYEAGAIPLGELLAVRRELVQAKQDYAELLLGAAAARTEFRASMGTGK